MTNLTRCYMKQTNLVTRDITGETIIVPVKGNVGDLDSIYTLNELGTLIWKLIDGKNSIRQIVDAICGAYEVTPEEAINDTIDFISAMEEKGLMKLKEEAE